MIKSTKTWAGCSAWITAFGIFVASSFALCTDDAGGEKGPAKTRVDFARDVLPILSDKCFSCHGPDAATRKAKLRLDTREGLIP
jgi:Planctomycete cytochrome C